MSKIPAAVVPVASYANSPIAQANVSKLAAPAINADAIRDRVLSKLVDATVVESAKDRFLRGAFGPGVGDKVGSELGQLRDLGGGHSKNPLNGIMDQNFAGTGRGRYRDDEETASGDTFHTDTFIGTVVEGLFNLFTFRGSPTHSGLLTGFGTVETVTGSAANALVGVQAVAQSGDKNPTIREIFNDMDHKMPVPDDGGSDSPTIITGAQVRGIVARAGGTREPVDGYARGSGGPVVASKTSTQAEYINEPGMGGRTDAKNAKIAIEARIQGNITII